MIKSISINDFLQLSYNVNIIDIRSIQKYNDSHIPNAINIPKQILLKDYNHKLNKNIPYYIYCQQGEQSIKICRLLSQMGYNVINISGGYENWLLSQ